MGIWSAAFWCLTILVFSIWLIRAGRPGEDDPFISDCEELRQILPNDSDPFHKTKLADASLSHNYPMITRSCAFSNYVHLIPQSAMDFSRELNKVMEETALLVLKYNDTLIHPYYHSISAGITRENSEEYIVPVDCPDDREDEKYLHTSVYSYETFINTVKEINSEIVLSADAPLEAFQIVSKDNAGYITELQIGGISVDVNTFSEKFSLSSLCFEIDEYNGGIRIITKGVGHGYGMSLNTAQIMGESGKSCNEILNTFYSGAVISE